MREEKPVKVSKREKHVRWSEGPVRLARLLNIRKGEKAASDQIKEKPE